MVKRSKEESVMEPVIIKEDDTGSKYDTPEIISFIVEKKNDGDNFNEITEKLQNRGFPQISPSVVSDLYKRGLARSITYHNTAKEVFNDFTKELQQTYGESLEVMGEMVRTLRDFIKQIKDLDPDSLEGKSMIIRIIPQITGLMREIRENVKLQADLQDKIVTTSEKEVQSSPSDIMKLINDYLPVLLKEKAKELKEKYGDSIPLKEIEGMKF